MFNGRGRWYNAGMDSSGPRRVIQVNQRIIGPVPPRPKTVRVRRRGDYPGEPAVYLDLAQLLASPSLMGPPLCDELLEFVRHAFTEEEAGAARHLGLFRGKTAAVVARSERRPVEQILPVLDLMENEKRLIVSSGNKAAKRYRILPIVPGMFENALMVHSPETLTDWHRRFIELFETLYESGFSLDYQERPTPAVRYLPVGRAIEAQPLALPTDKLAEVMDRYKVFAVANCQCRMAMQVLGQGCGKPIFNCMTMGLWAERSIVSGAMRQVSKKEALEIKREAESHGMVNWMMNVRDARGQSSCSCCGCCCHALRMINEFSSPGGIAPPHFMPRLDAARCVACGRCARVCPMGAIVVDLEAMKKTPPVVPWRHLRERCSGCGLCTVACGQQQALRMTPARGFRLPYRNWYSLIAHAMPGILRTNWRLKRERR